MLQVCSKNNQNKFLFLLLDSLSYIFNKIFNQNIHNNICERTVEDLSREKLLTLYRKTKDQV